MRAALALLLAFAAASPAFAQRAPPPLTWSRLHTISDEALVRHMFGDLAAFPVVSHRPERPRDFRFRPHRAQIWFWTRPRRSDRPGLCETDRMIVTFEPAPLAVGRDPVVGPRRFDLKTYYIVQDRARLRDSRGLDGADVPALDRACAALDPRRDGVPADYSWQLLHAFRLVDELGAGARAGRAVAPLDCVGMGAYGGTAPADEAACLRELAVLRDISVVWVQQCHAGPRGGNCLRVQTFRWFIEFELDQGLSSVRIVVNGIEDTSAIE